MESRGDQLVIEGGEEGRREGKGGGMETGTGRAGATASLVSGEASLMLSSASAGTLNRNESILVLTVCCGVFLLLLLSILVIVCLCCLYCSTRRHRSSYDIGTKEPPGEFKRQASLRKDNSGILMQSPSGNLFGDLSFTHNPPFNPPAIPLTTYGGIGGSVISDSIRQSHTPSPIPHTTGTLATSSLYSLEDQVSITTNLPNFPRANLKVGGGWVNVGVGEGGVGECGSGGWGSG